MSDKRKRIMFAGLLQGTRFYLPALMLRDSARELERYADLYEKLVGPKGKEDALREAERLRAEADKLEEQGHQEARRAAEIAAIVETWIQR